MSLTSGKITEKRIHAAIEQIIESGENPTQARIREVLGGGSFTTIGEVLRVWRDGEQENQTLLSSDMPDALRDDANVLIAKIWQTADHLANDRLAAAHDALKIAQAKADADMSETLETVVVLESDIENIQKNLLSMTDKAQQYEHDLARYSLERDELSKQLLEAGYKLEMQHERTNTENLRCSELNQRLVDTSKNLDSTQELLIKARESIATLTAVDEKNSSEVIRLQVEISEHKNQLQTIASQLTERTTERDSSKDAVIVTKTKLESANEQIQALTAERDALNIENRELMVKISSLEA